MTAEIFLDAAYAIALSSPRDQFHDRAIRLANQLDSTKAKLVTTRAVLLEIGNALSRQRYRRASVKLLVALEADPNVGRGSSSCFSSLQMRTANFGTNELRQSSKYARIRCFPDSLYSPFVKQIILILNHAQCRNHSLVRQSLHTRFATLS